PVRSCGLAAPHGRLARLRRCPLSHGYRRWMALRDGVGLRERRRLASAGGGPGWADVWGGWGERGCSPVGGGGGRTRNRTRNPQAVEFEFESLSLRSPEGISMGPIVQVSLDLMTIEDAMPVAETAARAGVDWLEAGTPLILGEGLRAVRALRSAFAQH